MARFMGGLSDFHKPAFESWLQSSPTACSSHAIGMGVGRHSLSILLPGGMHEWKSTLQRTCLEFSICCKTLHENPLDLELKISELVAEPVIYIDGHSRCDHHCPFQAAWVQVRSIQKPYSNVKTKLSFVRVYLGWQLQGPQMLAFDSFGAKGTWAQAHLLLPVKTFSHKWCLWIWSCFLFRLMVHWFYWCQIRPYHHFAVPCYPGVWLNGLCSLLC